MFSIIGIVVVLGSVFGGYLMHGGEMAVLFQPSEFLIIWGAALGSVIIATPLPILMRLLKNFGKVLGGSRYNKAAGEKLGSGQGGSGAGLHVREQDLEGLAAKIEQAILPLLSLPAYRLPESRR